MQEEIKDPLVDVLLENDIALTPTQRLLMVVGGQIIQMGISTLQFMHQNKEALKMFQQFHQESKEERIVKETAKHSVKYAQMKENQRRQQEEAEMHERNQEQQRSESTSNEKASNNVDTSEHIDIDKVVQETTEVKDVKSEPENTKNKLKVDDVLSVENGGITVEEEPS